MKKITFLLFVLTVSNSFAQAVINFENTGYYNRHDQWEGTSTIEGNPNASGINTSATVAKYVTPSGKAWGNASVLVLEEALSWSDLTSLQLDVYAPSVSSTFIKLEKEGVGGIAEAWFTPNSANVWESLTPGFTYNGSGDESTATFDKIVIFFNVNDNVGGESWYFDNILLNGLSLDATAPTGLAISKPAANAFKVTWNADANETGGVNVSIIEGATNIYVTTIASGSTEYTYQGTYTSGENTITVADGGNYTFVLQALPDANSNAYATISTETLSVGSFKSIGVDLNYNTSSEDLTIVGNEIEQNGVVISIYNITGQEVLKTNSSVANLSGLSSGIYIILVETKFGKKGVKKFSK